jgi:hypothetical protein
MNDRLKAAITNVETVNSKLNSLINEVDAQVQQVERLLNEEFSIATPAAVEVGILVATDEGEIKQMLEYVHHSGCFRIAVTRLVRARLDHDASVEDYLDCPEFDDDEGEDELDDFVLQDLVALSVESMEELPDPDAEAMEPGDLLDDEDDEDDEDLPEEALELTMEDIDSTPMVKQYQLWPWAECSRRTKLQAFPHLPYLIETLTR